MKANQSPLRCFLNPNPLVLGAGLINSIVEILNDEQSTSIASLSIRDYLDGIRSAKNVENGLYFLYFPNDTYYVGIAASCTMIERLAKHLDGRKAGSFNSVLKNMGKEELISNYYESNQEFFSDAKVLFMPFNFASIKVKPDFLTTHKIIAKRLEEDLIFLMEQKGMTLRNKRKPKQLSNVFYYED